ncbi:MAG: VWA domain-containing protein [bacterium]|nr:VWA domain-containing protein [bacterium]
MKYATLASLVLLAVVSSAQWARPQGAIFLIDRTGSMSAEIPWTGTTRCEDATASAIIDIRSFFSLHPAGQGAVWTFSGDRWIDETGGFTDLSACSTAVVNLLWDMCEGATPLADAVCASADALLTYFPAPQERVLYLATDGYEANSSGECSGPPAVAGPPYTPDSWQGKVMAKLVATGTVNIRHWGWEMKSGTTYNPEIGEVRLPAVTDCQFFQDLVAATGGVYTPMPHHHHHSGVPALSQWSIICLLALLLASGAVLIYRKKSIPYNPA